MKAINAALQAAIIALAILSFANEAKAGGLIECNNCASPTSVALQSGSGLTVIIDFEKAQLTAFNVEYDRELRKWRAVSTPVPSQIQMAFLRIVESVSNTNGQPDQAFPQAGGGAVVPMHPDNPGNSNGMRFPDAYRSSDAFEIVNSATMRTRLGQYLALEIAGANTSSAAWNSFALSVQQFALSWASIKGGSAVNVIITWRDGSKTLYKITPDNVSEGKYQKGESRDSTGNKVPDETIADPATAPSYAGQYYFGREGDLDKWVRSAQMYGVPVQRGSSSRMSCNWDGHTVYCQQY